MLHEEQLNSDSLIASINDLSERQEQYIENMSSFEHDAVNLIYNLLIETAKKT